MENRAEWKQRIAAELRQHRRLNSTRRSDFRIARRCRSFLRPAASLSSCSIRAGSRRPAVALILAAAAVSYSSERIGGTNRRGPWIAWQMRSSCPGAGADGASPSARARSRRSRMPPFFAFPILWITLPGPRLADRRRGGGSAKRPRAAARARPSPSAGGSASAISSPASGGSATPSWWRRTSSPGCMPLAVIVLPAGLALFWGLGVARRAAPVERGLAAHLRARRRAWRGRMAARPPPLRLSLERHRLRADRPARS